MNGALHHAARPGDIRSSHATYSGFKKAATFAKQMGLDLKGDMCQQAESFWRMLDDMAQSDPKTYNEIINQQMTEGKAAWERRNGRFFVPDAGFVLKAHTLQVHGSVSIKTLGDCHDAGRKVFINVCSHKAVGPPQGPSGAEITHGDLVSANSLSIPLVVGKLREVRDREGSNCSAVDVVINPFPMEQALKHRSFQSQLITLVHQWVEQETGLKLDRKGCKVIKSQYKGGTGEDHTDPVPFPVDEATSQDAPPEARPHSSSEHDSSASSRGSGPSLGPKKLNDPQAVLQEVKMRAHNNTNAGGNIVLPGRTQKEGGAATGLVKELRPDGSFVEPAPLEHDDKDRANTVEGHSNRAVPADEVMSQAVSGDSAYTSSSSRRESMTTAPLIKKGFLGSIEGRKASLYPEEGSGEGGVEGPWSKLLGRSKVVDTTSMPKEQVEQMMRAHAGGSADTAKTERDAPRAKRAVDLPQPSQQRPCVLDEEFERLMESLDPELARRKESDMEEDDAMEQLAKLANALGSFPSLKPTVVPPTERTNVTAESVCQNVSAKDTPRSDVPEAVSRVDPDKAAASLDGGLKHATLPHELREEVDGSLRILIDMRSIYAGGVMPALSEVDLVVGDSCLSVTLPSSRSVEYRIDFPIIVDTESVKASMKKKTGMLQLSCQRKGATQ